MNRALQNMSGSAGVNDGFNTAGLNQDLADFDNIAGHHTTSGRLQVTTG